MYGRCCSPEPFCSNGGWFIKYAAAAAETIVHDGVHQDARAT
jgi:hypothetical protein